MVLQMANLYSLKRLFYSHMTDLNDFHAGIGNYFVCPICCRVFSEKDILNKFLDYGHIWPCEIRKKSKLAINQAVLLCKKCNSSAGGKGDAQMQLYEKILARDGFRELYEIRTVEIVENLNEKPIRMRVTVQQNGVNLITVKGKLNHKMQWLGSSSDDQKRFEELSKRCIDTQQKLNITILPPTQFKSDLVRVGWITSAYLMAFYTLGYRYILHRDLDFVRDYIISSFNPSNIDAIPFSAREDFHIYTDNLVDHPNPQVRLSVPLKNNEPVRLEICYMKYEISLPIPLEPKIFQTWLTSCLKTLSRNELNAAMENNSPCIYVYIHCTKTVEHTCVYDYLLGKQ